MNKGCKKFVVDGIIYKKEDCVALITSSGSYMGILKEVKTYIVSLFDKKTCEDIIIPIKNIKLIRKITC